MTMKGEDLFELQDKQNIDYNKKLAKKPDFKEIVYKILDKKYNNLKERCRVQDYSVPRLETIENVFNDFIKENDFRCYYCEMTMLYFSAEYRKNETSPEKEQDFIKEGVEISAEQKSINIKKQQAAKKLNISLAELDRRLKLIKKGNIS